MSNTVASSEATVRITEIFHSLQGEARTVGLPTVFVRLTGCPLRCVYCDTEYAFSGGELMSIGQICEQVAAYHPRYVTVTGGEPLAQKACIKLLQKLCDADYRVSLETSGAMDISRVDPRVSRVVDMKTPASAENDRNLLDNLEMLTRNDQVKFVICDRDDYEWSKSMVAQFGLLDRSDVLFSPAVPQLAPTELADWILADQLNVRFQIQLHKILWGDARGK